MTSEHLDAVTDHLATLQGRAIFRLQPGPLKERLTQEVLNAVTGEVAEALSEGSFDLEVNLMLEEGEKAPTFTFTVDHPGAAYTAEIAITLLADDALVDLAGYLLKLCESFVPAEMTTAAETPRFKYDEAHHFDIGAASGRLKVSPEWLKRVVPCTDYTYEEIEGKKYIRGYYWSKELIERLFKIKSTKTTPEDLQYVARECCEGDVDWARDLIARLKSPNRPEAPPKEQPQSRPAQNQNRSGQNQNRSAQNQNRSAQNQNRSAQNQNRPAQAQNRPATENAAPSERARQRSRHKRPSRDIGKDAGPKPEPAANQHTE